MVKQTALPEHELQMITGGSPPCAYDPPEGFFDRVDYFIGYTYGKFRLSLGV